MAGSLQLINTVLPLSQTVSGNSCWLGGIGHANRACRMFGTKLRYRQGLPEAPPIPDVFLLN